MDDATSDNRGGSKSGTGVGQPMRWLLLTGNRSAIAAVLSAALETNFAREIQRLESVQRTHGDDIPAAVDEAIGDVRDRLREMDIARQYFKSMYLQVELSRLSRYLLYAGVPAVGTAIAALFALTAAVGPPFGKPVRVILFPTTVAVGVFPLALLFAYILRTATVTERTAAITPFTTPEQEP